MKNEKAGREGREAEASTGLDCNACGDNIDEAEQCDNVPVLCSADVASVPCAMCGQDLGRGVTYCADCDYCNGEGFTGRGTVEDEGGNER
jgi:hypothetical protein